MPKNDESQADMNHRFTITKKKCCLVCEKKRNAAALESSWLVQDFSCLEHNGEVLK